MNWLRRVFSRRKLERSLDAELRDHFERFVADKTRAGMSESESRRAARIELGNLDQIKAECRDARGTNWLESTLQDLRFVLRNMRKSPGFAVSAILTLALGVGANTAIFSVINTVFLRPLPLGNAERIVWASEFFPKFKDSIVLTPEYAAWARQNSTFEQVAAYALTRGVNWTSANQPAERLQAGHVTPHFFDLLEVRPVTGRLFQTSDDTPGARVAIVSDSFWHRSLHADRNIVGKPLTIDGALYAVIGVVPADFPYPNGSGISIWLPDAVPPESKIPALGMGLVDTIGLLKKSVTLEQARMDLNRIARNMDHEYPGAWARNHSESKVRVTSLREQMTYGSQTAIYVLAGAVAFVLLIVCANVANLFLGRSLVREKELAVRAALGASRMRLARMLLTEAAVFSVLGGMLGLLAAFLGNPALRFLIPEALTDRAAVDLRVFAFALACSLASACLFGLLPALTASKVDLNTRLKETRASSLRPGRWSTQSFLAVAQLALCLVLLSGASLLLRTFTGLLTMNPGFDPHNILLSDVFLGPPDFYTPPRQVQYFDRLLAAVQRIPGVQYAALTSSPPAVPFNAVGSGLHAEGEPETNAVVCFTSVSDGFFRAFHIPLLQGRPFDERDGLGAPPTLILSQTLAHILFQDRNPIGRRVPLDSGDNAVGTVIGVAADIRHRALDDKIWPELYQSYRQFPNPFTALVIRGFKDPANLTETVRKISQTIDPTQPVYNYRSQEEVISGSLSQRRNRAYLLAVFALLALGIAVVGIYGVVSYAVAQRTKEIGVRVSLGAQPHQVLTAVTAGAMRIAFFGVAIGLCAAFALRHVLSSFLYGVSPSDIVTFTCVPLLLAASAALAAYIPARRALAVDPMTALRHE